MEFDGNPPHSEQFDAERFDVAQFADELFGGESPGAESQSAEPKPIGDRKMAENKTSDAQRAAVMRYQTKNKDRIHKFSVTIYDSKDPELWEWLNSQDGGRGTAVRKLIREEIERTGWEPK